jgi:hypothetical protein
MAPRRSHHAFVFATTSRVACVCVTQLRRVCFESVCNDGCRLAESTVNVTAAFLLSFNCNWCSVSVQGVGECSEWSYNKQLICICGVSF